MWGEYSLTTMNIVERVKGICVAPDAEWAVIAAERATLGGLLTSYVLPLAGLSAVGSLLGRKSMATLVPSRSTRWFAVGSSVTRTARSEITSTPRIGSRVRPFSGL